MDTRKFGGKVKITSDFKKLNQLVASFADANDKVVKVGILKNTTSRIDGELTNASLGLIHEFGSYTRNIPERSFIRMPLRKKQDELVREIKGRISEHLFQPMMPLLKRIGIMGERVIGEAFRTSGFGTWEPLKPATMARKQKAGHIERILMDTGQLSRSITSIVAKRGQ